jgi:arylsulfatase A-like enzyme
LLPNVRTLAEDLRARGYRTGGVVANAGFLGEWTGLARGFEYYDSGEKGRFFGYPPLVLGLAHRWWPAMERGLRLSNKPPADQITDAAIGWLEAVRGQPFFLFLNYLDAHDPYQPPPPFDVHFTPPAGSIHVENVRDLANALDRGRHQLLPQEREFLLSQYDREIAFADQELGRLLDWMDSARLLDDSLVIVTADHGEFFGEHGFLLHLRTLYEQMLQVPLVIKLPRQRQGREIGRRSSLQQMRELIGRVIDTPNSDPAFFQGLIDQDAPIEAEAWTFNTLHRRNPTRYSSRASRAIYRGSLKLIQTDDGRDELFDLDADPHEERNLLVEDRARAIPLVLDMTRLLPPLQVEARRKSPVVDRDAQERLRALGYVR